MTRERVGLLPALGAGALATDVSTPLLVWLPNSAVVLPTIGEGFAGSRHLSLAGMAMFAAIHTVFLLPLAVWEARLSLVMAHASRSS